MDIYHVYKYELRIFCLNAEVLYSKYALHRLLYIFPHFWQFVNTTSVNVPPLPRIVHRDIFSHLRTNRNAAQQVREVIDANDW